MSESQMDEEIIAEATEQAEIVIQPDTADGNQDDEIVVAEALTEAPSAPEFLASLKAIIEAAIYITDEPLLPEQIAAAIDQPLDRVREILRQLVIDYSALDRGLSVRELAGGYKMATKPEHHEAVRRFVRNLQPTLKLSMAALETLAVIAYKQPITGPEIMDVRGVQGIGVLKTLLDRKLIATAGRKNVLGKPMQYKTSREFLIQFGLSSLAELPTLKEFEELGRLALSGPDEAPFGEARNSQATPSQDSNERPLDATTAIEQPSGEMPAWNETEPHPQMHKEEMHKEEDA